MNRCLKWVGATAALALTGCVSAQQPLSNVCNPGFSSFSFGVNSTWLLDVGPQGCTSTLNLSGGAVIARRSSSLLEMAPPSSKGRPGAIRRLPAIAAPTNSSCR